MDFQKLYSTTCILEQTHENQQKVKIYSHEQRIRCSFSMQLFSKPCDLSKSSQIMAKGSGSSHLSCRRFPNPLLKVKISNRTSRSLSLTVSHIWIGLLWAHHVPLIHVLLLGTLPLDLCNCRKNEVRKINTDHWQSRGRTHKGLFSFYSALRSAFIWKK